MGGIQNSLTPARQELHDDGGSTLPLILGYAVLVIALIIVCVCATDLHIAQKRLDGLADAASLAAVDGFTIVADGEQVYARLSNGEVRAQAVSLLSAIDSPATLISAHTPDGTSAEVTLTVAWHPPILSPFVPEGILLESTARSRTAFR